MSAGLYKYGVALHLYKPMIKRAVMDFAVGADWTPAAGDVKISKDGGAAANVTNLPTAIAMGNTALWDFSLTTTEMQAAKVRITVADAATKAVEDQAFEIDTYGNASAQHLVDLSDGVRAGLTALPNAAAEAAGGLYTRGAGAGQVTQSVNGLIDGNVVRWGGVVVVAADATGRILVMSGVTPNVAVSNFLFKMTDATTHLAKSGIAGGSFTKQYSLDGAAFSALSGTVTEVSNGWYKISLTAGELNFTRNVALRFIAAGADDTDLTLIER